MYDAFAPLYTITIHFPQCSAQLELELHSTPPAPQRHRIGAFALWLQVTKITIQNLPPNDLLITLYYISRYLYMLAWYLSRLFDRESSSFVDARKDRATLSGRPARTRVQTLNNWQSINHPSIQTSSYNIASCLCNSTI